MAANVYHEVVQVEVRDQSAAALTTVQRNVEKTESSLNSISKAPFAIVVKLTDMLTRPLQAMISTASSMVKRGLSLPVTLADKVTGPFRSMMSSMSGAGANVLQGIGQGVGMTVIGLAAQGFGMVKGAIIDMNATLETSQLQFETLMGNADDAQKHVADLFEFAKKTPFETQPVIDASRLLRTFGGATLDTMDNLTLFGNASAATSSDIKEVSFWFGRAYAAMQAGQPFGEATMRLQELAILSPQAAAKLEQLQKSGANADTMWKAMTGDLTRFNGAMDKQASTWTGLTSTLSDAITLTSAKLFQPLFKVAKRGVDALNNLFSSDAFEAWADSAGKSLADFVDKAMTNVGLFVDAIKAIGAAFTVDKGAIGIVGDVIEKVFGKDVANFVRPMLKAFMDFIPTLKSVGQWIGFAFQDLMKGDFKNFGKDLVIAFQQLTGIDLSGAFDAISNGISWLADVGFPLFQQAMEFAISFVVHEVGPAMAALAGMLKDWLTPAWEWFTGTAWPAILSWLTTVSDYISGTAIPRLTDLAAALSPALQKAYEQAGGAFDDFNHKLQGDPKAVDDQTQAYKSMSIVLDPLAVTFQHLGGIWQSLGKIGVELFDAISKVWGLLADDTASNGASAMSQALQPLVDWLNLLNTALFVVDTVLKDVADEGPHMSDIFVLIGGAVDDLNTKVEGFLKGAAAWAANLRQIGTDTINGFIQGLASVDVGAWFKTNVGDRIPQVVKDALGIHSPSQVMADLGNNLMQGFLNGMSARMPDIMAFIGNLSNVFGGTDVGGWIDAAIRATGVPASWAGPLSQIIQAESGGNPAATNLTDVNAQNGNASVGLMQLTGTNRAQYTPAGMNPLDPIAQIIAGINYIKARYGDISAVPGVASLAGGGAYVPYDAGGVLPPGVTMAANNTGANEFVMTPGQMAGMGGSLVFAPVFNIDATGAGPGVGDEINASIEDQSSRLFQLLGSQLRVAFGNLAVEGGAT